MLFFQVLIAAIITIFLPHPVLAETSSGDEVAVENQVEKTTVEVLTLEQAIENALRFHPSVENARAGIEVAREERREAISGYFPELQARATGGRVFGDNATSRGLSVTRGDGYSYLWEGSVTATQMIFDGFETPSRVDSAEAKKKSATMDLADAKENLAFRTAQQYIDVLRARAGLKLLLDHKQKLDDYIARIRSAVNEGAADEAELQQALDIGVILQTFITDYTGQIQAAQASYYEVVGDFPPVGLQTPAPRLEMIPGNVQDALDVAHDSHPSLQSAGFRSDAVEHEIDVERAQLYPDIDGELSYLKTDKRDIIGGEVVDARAVMRMNWNYETGGAQHARIKKKKKEYQQSMARLHELRRQISRDIRLAYAEMDVAEAQLESQEKRYELNQKLFDTYKVQFEGARISLLQLMQADNQLLNTKLEKLNGEHRLLTSYYAVLASMGRLQDTLSLAGVAQEPAVISVAHD